MNQTPNSLAPCVIRWSTIAGRLFRTFVVIGILVLTACVAIAYFSQKEYVATARLLPPFGEQDSLSVMQGALGGFPTASWWEPEDTNEANFIIIGILKSDRVFDAVISTLKLTEREELSTQPMARRWLRKSCDFLQDRHKLIVINVTTSDPDLSANIANAFVLNLSKVQRGLRSGQRSYQEKQLSTSLESNRSQKVSLETAFESFKREHNLVDIESQTKATVELLAHLKAIEAEERVEMSGNSKFYSDQHGSVSKLNARLGTLKDLQLSLQNKEHTEEDLDMLDLKNIPSLQRDFLNYVHEIEGLKETGRLLSQQLEVIKVFEAGNFPETTVLDHATPPDQDASPGIAKRIIIGGLLTGFLYMTAIVFSDLVLHFLPNYLWSLRPVRMLGNVMKWLNLQPITTNAHPA